MQPRLLGGIPNFFTKDCINIKRSLKFTCSYFYLTSGILGNNSNYLFIMRTLIKYIHLILDYNFRKLVPAIKFLLCQQTLVPKLEH